MTIEEIYKRIFKNFKILGLGKILSGLFSALTIFVLAQYLGVEIFGIIAITISMYFLYRFVEVYLFLISDLKSFLSNELAIQGACLMQTLQ